MAKPKFPYQAFVVTPALLIKEVTIVGLQYPHFSMYSNWHAAEGGKGHRTDNLHSTRELAIQAAEKTLAEQEARLTKSQTNLAKRRANLTKAKGI